MATVEPILDRDDLPSPARRDLDLVVDALDRMLAPRERDSGPDIVEVAGRFGSLLSAVACGLAYRPATRAERLFLRCAVLDPNLLSPELRDATEAIAEDEPDDSGVWYLDEWLLGPAARLREASGGWKQRESIALRASAAEASTHAALSELWDVHSAIVSSAEQLQVAAATLAGLLPESGEPRPDWSELLSRAREERSSTVGRLLADVGRLATLDRGLQTSLGQLVEARSALGPDPGTGHTPAVDPAGVMADMEIARQLMRVCLGTRGSPFPVLMARGLRGNARELLNDRASVAGAMARVEAVDTQAFRRRYRGLERRVPPNVLILPSYGARGICHEPWPRSFRELPGLVAVPFASTAYPNVAAVAGLASHRWLAARELAGSYWTSDGLTGQYAHLHSGPRDAQLEAEFSRDYAIWITDESEGRPKLEAKTRALFWRALPFPKETREWLGSRSAAYSRLLDRDRRRASSRLAGLGPGGS